MYTMDYRNEPIGCDDIEELIALLNYKENNTPTVTPEYAADGSRNINELDMRTGEIVTRKASKAKKPSHHPKVQNAEVKSRMLQLVQLIHAEKETTAKELAKTMGIHAIGVGATVRALNNFAGGNIKKYITRAKRNGNTYFTDRKCEELITKLTA